MSYPDAIQVVGTGTWADDAAAQLLVLGYRVARVATEASDLSGATWVFWERAHEPHPFVWLIDGDQHGAAAVTRWHDVYGHDAEARAARGETL